MTSLLTNFNICVDNCDVFDVTCHDNCAETYTLALETCPCRLGASVENKSIFIYIYFRPKLFSAKTFFGQRIFWPNFFGQKIFFVQKWFFRPKNIFCAKTIFFGQKSNLEHLSDHYFLTKKGNPNKDQNVLKDVIMAQIVQIITVLGLKRMKPFW